MSQDAPSPQTVARDWACQDEQSRLAFANIMLEHLTEQIDIFHENPKRTGLDFRQREPAVFLQRCIEEINQQLLWIRNAADGVTRAVNAALAEDGESDELTKVIEGFKTQDDRMKDFDITVWMVGSIRTLRFDNEWPRL